MHIALKGCGPPHSNEPVQFWIGCGLVLIDGSDLNPLDLRSTVCSDRVRAARFN